MTDYLDWESTLSLDIVFKQHTPQAYPTLYADGVIYLTSLPEEQGRSVLMWQPLAHSETGNNGAICLTKRPLSLRTRLNEYGGKPFWVNQDQLLFINDADQCVYQLSLPDTLQAARHTAELSMAGAGKGESEGEGDGDGESNPQLTQNALMPTHRRLTQVVPSKPKYHYAEVREIGPDQYLAIVEECVADAAENLCYLGFLAGTAGSMHPVALSPQADFFSNLMIDRKAQRLAWVQWQHPHMPWDANELWVADYRLDALGNCVLDQQQRIVLPAGASVCQTLFTQQGDLFFVADFPGHADVAAENFWNIWRVDLEADQLQPRLVTNLQAEFGYPHWQFEDCRLAQLDATTLIAIGSEAERDRLFTIDLNNDSWREIEFPACGWQNLFADGQGTALCVARFNDRAEQLVMIECAEHSVVRPLSEVVAAPHVDDEAMQRQSWPQSYRDVSVAQHISFPTSGGATAHAFFYPPANHRYTQPSSGQPTNGVSSNAPPLLVMVHGGPTSRCYGAYDLQKQYWTQRGFAIVDINHRGSNGYGRNFRDALYGEWGNADADDVAAAIRYLIDEQRVDPERICIRGKSAGGYAVLRALTEHADIFQAGACYYGIGNLITLAETTHKFERYYADRLIGESFDKQRAAQPSSRFQSRSPINKVGDIRAAMIVFQGAEDKIVPPSVAHEIINALKSQQIVHKYVEYAAEGHGFRQAGNNIDAWQKELAFYKTALAK